MSVYLFNSLENFLFVRLFIIILFIFLVCSLLCIIVDRCFAFSLNFNSDFLFFRSACKIHCAKVPNYDVG